MRILLKLFAFTALGGFLSANMCTKVVTYGADSYTPSLSKSYYSDLTSVLEQTEAVLKNMGFAVANTDESRSRVTTGWLPVTSDSHYLNLFNRKDYSAASGAYYQVVVDVADATPTVRVSVSTVVKSVAGKLSSGGVVEENFLKKLDDQLRSPQIEMTNVGVKGR